MTTLTELLTDIALGTIDRHSVLVIKNLSSSVSVETLVNWVNVVTDEDVKDDVCHYHHPLTTVSIVVLDTSVRDKIDHIQKKALIKKLEKGKRVLDVSPIEQPAGLLLLDSQGHKHSEDSLNLYFESPRSGGKEDSVQSVHHKDSGITVVTFFPGSLPTAVENILRKGRESGHLLNDKPLTVVPYYPGFHNCIIDQLAKTKTSNTEPISAKHSVELERHGSNHHDSIHDEPQKLDFYVEEEYEEDKSSIEDNNNVEVMTDGDCDAGSASSGKGQGERELEKNIELLKQNLLKNEKIQDQICPWEDDDSNSLKPSYETKQTNKKSGNLTLISGDLPFSDHTRRKTKQKALVIQKTNPKVSHQTQEKGPKYTRPSETEIISLPKHKIILLRISSFGRKMKNVEIDLNSEKEQVRITGMREDIQTVIDEMRNKLTEVKQHDHKIPDEIALLLEHKMRVPDFTRQTLMSDKIYAHVICLAKENNIRAYAFQRDHAKKAVDKMLSLIQSEDISYTDCHFKYLRNAAWQNLVQKWEGLGLVKIKLMKTEKKIRVMSLASPTDVVRDIEKELEKFSDVTGKPISIEGGKGMMLHYCLQDKMRQMESDVRHSGGQMDHEYKAGTYLVTVQGSPNIVQKTESKLRSLTFNIWEGNVDLGRLEGKSKALSGEELAVVIEGISSKKGKDFLRRFSIEHSCVVLFSSQQGARPSSRFDEPKGLMLNKRSSSMPFLEMPSTKPRNRHSRADWPEHSQSAQDMQTPPRHKSRTGSGNRDEHDRRYYEDFSRQRKPGRSSRLSKSIQIRNCTISVKKGSIIKEMASISVNVVGESRNLTESFISRQFCELGGPALEKSFKRVDIGENVVFTPSSGGLLCENVCHLVLRKWRFDQKRLLQNEIESSLQEIFLEAKNLRASSIAFPGVGTGRLLDYPVPFIAEYLLSGAVTACKQGTSLQKVTFVIYDEKQLEVFIKQLEREEEKSAHLIQHPQNQVQVPVFPTGSSRQEAPISLVHPRSKSDVSQGSMTLFCTPKEKGEELRSTLSADLRKSFLDKDKIQLHSEKVDKRRKKKITVLGEKEAVHSVTKNVYKILHESAAEQAPKKYSPPHGDKHGTSSYWVELFENPPVPQYWKYFKGGYGFMDYFRKLFNKGNRTEILDVDSTTFGYVKSVVERTFDRKLVGHGHDAKGLTHSQIVIRKVERIENYSLYEAYALERRKFFKRKGSGKSKCLPLETIPQKNKGPITTTQCINSHLLSDMFKDINEHYFFHGTDDERIKRISEKGLDPRYGGNGMFGQGIYGAECSTKADQYADTSTSRQSQGRKMLMMRLLLGDTFVTSVPEKYSLPPCKTCNKVKCLTHHHNYDSVVADGQWLFREFVVYDKNQCYPEYIITYDRQ
ncbi:uncharacterized protein LOC132562332 [Ylistrum balloti]|uniref:uncharacterized protein LOC132562332 n=1 Tax=Ylistrum balloti TaxID=509963 RepID=UPI002905C1D5|nr:uncharacterized protein LOC132562332 [Ylistrum balloti]